MASPRVPVIKQGNLEDFLEAHLKRCQTEIENLVTNIRKKGRACFTVAMLKGRLAGLDKAWEEAMSRHAVVIASVDVADRDKLEYFQQDYINILQEVVFDARDFINEELARLQPPQEQVLAPPAPAVHAAQEPPAVAPGYVPLRLPETKIPRFKGDPREWFSFRDLFTAVIINHRHLSDSQRLQQLRTCLDGVALRSISNLEICDRNFQVAWDTLERLFAKKRVVIKALLTPLRTLKSIKWDKLESIEQVTIDIRQTVEALRRWECPVDQWGILLVDKVTEKLDERLTLEWEESIQDNDDYPEFETLLSFLDKKAGALHSIQLKTQGHKEERSRHEKSQVHSHTSTLETKEDSLGQCLFCAETHSLENCDQFHRLNANERYKFAKLSRHCIICLSRQHGANPCPDTNRCARCGLRHHTLLHFDRTEESSSAKSQANSRGKPSSTGNSKKASTSE